MSDPVTGRGLSGRGAWGLVLLAVALILLAALAAAPFVWRMSLDESIAERLIEQRFIEARLKAAKTGNRPLLTAADKIDGIFLPGATSGIAMAELQGLIAKLATGNGLSVKRSQPLQEDRKGNLAVLRMEVETEGDIASLRDYLLAVEAGQPFLFITGMRITAPDARAEDGAALPSDKLAVALQLEAFAWWEDKP